VETTRIMQFYVQRRYGDSVQVNYVDLGRAEAKEGFGELRLLIAEQNLPYPLVAVNGQLRLAGSADYYRVIALVEEALQADPAPGADL
jgi:disulfide oxidoreductase YuzD